MARTQVKISKRQAKELVEQLKKDANYHVYEGKLGYYFSFTSKKGDIIITVYEFDKKYFLEISSLS